MSDIEAQLREVAGTATRAHAQDRRSLTLGAEDCARLVELLDEARWGARRWREAFEEAFGGTDTSFPWADYVYANTRADEQRKRAEKAERALDEALRDRDLYKRDFEAARDWRDALEEARDEARGEAEALRARWGHRAEDYPFPWEEGDRGG